MADEKNPQNHHYPHHFYIQIILICILYRRTHSLNWMSYLTWARRRIFVHETFCCWVFVCARACVCFYLYRCLLTAEPNRWLEHRVHCIQVFLHFGEILLTNRVRTSHIIIQPIQTGVDSRQVRSERMRFSFRRPETPTTTTATTAARRKKTTQRQRHNKRQANGNKQRTENIKFQAEIIITDELAYSHCIGYMMLAASVWARAARKNAH